MNIDLTKAKDPVIVSNHAADATYSPYCMRCSGLRRMVVVEPFLFRHHCGAVHDERQVIVPRLCGTPTRGHSEGRCTLHKGHAHGCWFPGMWNDM